MILILEPRPTFTTPAGKHVRITSGPYQSLLGSVLPTSRWDSSGRVMVQLQLSGQGPHVIESMLHRTHVIGSKIVRSRTILK